MMAVGRDMHRHFEGQGQGLKWKKGHFSYLFNFFSEQNINILGMCDIDKKYINIFWDFIDRQYLADCVIVLIS